MILSLKRSTFIMLTLAAMYIGANIGVVLALEHNNNRLFAVNNQLVSQMSQQKIGDLNGDGKVDDQDATIMYSHWTSSKPVGDSNKPAKVAPVAPLRVN